MIEIARIRLHNNSSGPAGPKFCAKHSHGAVARIGLLAKVRIFLMVPSLIAAFAFSGQAMTLAWSASSSAGVAGYRVYYGGMSGNYTNSIDVGNVTSNAVSGLTSAATYYFAVTSYTTNRLESDFSAEISYTVPGLTTTFQISTSTTTSQGTTTQLPQSYTSINTLGTLRNDFSGFVGMEIVVGANPVYVTALGRVMAPGNSGVHLLKLVKDSDGSDVPGGSVSLKMGTAPVGQFQYGTLATPVWLSANSTYYLVSQETSGADGWYNDDTTVNGSAVAREAAAVWGYGPGQWYSTGGAGHSYVPVSFQSTASASQTYVQSVSLGTPRNNFTGFVGMQITTGSNPMYLTALGRVMVTGNNQAHIVKLVKAADGTDVPGASVTITMGSVVAGQFQYASLSTPVWLPAATTYYLVTQETDGGDQWYGDDTSLTESNVAIQSAALWGYGPGQWYPAASTGKAYGPVDFKLVTVQAAPYVIAMNLGTTRNDFTGFVGIKILTGSNSLPVTALGRFVASGNTGVHIVKIVNASDGTDLPGASVSIQTSSANANHFQYVSLINPVWLSANSAYYVVSKETAGGDAWFHDDTVITGSTVAMPLSAAWGTGAGSWGEAAGPGHTYGPVSLKYIGSAEQAYISSKVLGTLRNNFSGYVGMQIVTGPVSVNVTALGRITAPGNTATHTLKLVRGSDGSDVPGGTISLKMGTEAAGKFQYARLSQPVLLPPNTAYYLLSSEMAGADSWYDDDTTVAGVPIANEATAVWGYGSGTWNLTAGQGQTYVPLDFKFAFP